jgi:hypothetical protein
MVYWIGYTNFARIAKGTTFHVVPRMGGGPPQSIHVNERFMIDDGKGAQEVCAIVEASKSELRIRRTEGSVLVLAPMSRDHPDWGSIETPGLVQTKWVTVDVELAPPTA